MGKEFKTKARARSFIRKIVSKPTRGRTSFRSAQSGTGLNNPRIIKRKVFRV